MVRRTRGVMMLMARGVAWRDAMVELVFPLLWSALLGGTGGTFCCETASGY